MKIEIENISLLKKKWKISFKHVIEYLNNNKQDIPSVCIDALRSLIIFWKLENNKTHFDCYFDIKKYHSIVSGYLLEIEEIKPLWREYLNLGLEFRCNIPIVPICY
jgi:hypothetical protein